MNIKEKNNALISGIKGYFKKSNFKKAVIGLSGGIDSSVSACLAVEALGSKNVAAILMPDLGTTSRKSIEDAKLIIKKLKIKHYVIPINDIVKYFKGINNKLKTKKNVYAVANVKARARMMILYYFANIGNALVIGTSDKSEIALGYTTKYGDNAADILIIGDLWKTEVIEMGRFLGIPSSILMKKSSAELIIRQTAEKELGASYGVLDSILKMYIEEDLSVDKIIEKGFNKKLVKKIIDMVRLNEHKRRSPVLIRVSERSFHGTGDADNE